MEVIILAGGKGTRLGLDVPKPMAPIHDKPFIKYLMDYWISQGASRFIISVGHQAAMIMNNIGRVYEDIPVYYAMETVPMGTGGGLMLAYQYLRSPFPFVVVNGDTYFQLDFQHLLHEHTDCHADITIAMRTNLENAGTYIMQAGVLDDIGTCEQSLELDTFHELVTSCYPPKRIRGFMFDAPFIDIGTPEEYERAKDFFKKEVDSPKKV